MNSAIARFSRAVLLPIALVGAMSFAARLAAQSGGSVEAGFTSIFNGKDLTGWKVYGEEKWFVEGGELICESGPKKEYGYLGTEKEYKDFEIRLKFKQEADGNSGLFFRSVIPEGIAIKGWQAEVAPHGSNTGRIYESGRTDGGKARGWITPEVTAEQDAALKYGEWNDYTLRVVGDHVQTWLNGVAVADLHDEVIGKTTGHIFLQIHSGGGIKVRWKDLRVQEVK